MLQKMLSIFYLVIFFFSETILTSFSSQIVQGTSRSLKKKKTRKFKSTNRDENVKKTNKSTQSNVS